MSTSRAPATAPASPTVDGRRARVIAHYLPQFHPIPENDQNWGRGFTEWTKVATARPLFRGHVQPTIPSDLGFYDLRVPEVRGAQADLARLHGVEGFAYWHYWFAGRRVLERPFEEVLASGEPDFPFCLAWANHSWTRTWEGRSRTVLIEQTYPGPDDHRRHFKAIEAALHDPRYLRVNGEPLFFLFRPQDIPDLGPTVELWKELARSSGLPGMHVVGRVEGYWSAGDIPRLATDLDAVSDYSLGYVTRGRRRLRDRIYRRLRGHARPTPYAAAVDAIPRLVAGHRSYPQVLTGWDTTPRHGPRATILHGRTPADFEQMVRRAVELVEDRQMEERLIFLKSWNEWAEGNYLEPDLTWGLEFLQGLDRATARSAG